VGLEWGPLRLVSTTEELRERKSSSFSLESRECGRRYPRDNLYPQKLLLTSFTRGDRSICIVRSRANVTKIYKLKILYRFIDVVVMVWTVFVWLGIKTSGRFH
jgi:hypothetical protein